MKKNMGSADRVIRVLIAIAIAALIVANVLTGVLAWVLGIFAVVFLATSFVSVCPLYMPFHISTTGKKEQAAS